MPFKPDIHANMLINLQVDRNKEYRRLDPDLSFEDAFDGTAKKLIQNHGRRVARLLDIPLHRVAEAKVFHDLAYHLDTNGITYAAAGIVLEQIAREQGGDVGRIILEKRMWHRHDGENERRAITEVVMSNPPALNDYVGGHDSALGALMGICIRKIKGLNPLLLRQEWEKFRQSVVQR
jgi:Asp-tRNA(Asn)/Glu-tRNA(Gln) amidotransferase B subunit